MGVFLPSIATAMVELSKLCKERILMTSSLKDKSANRKTATKSGNPKVKPIKLRVFRTHKPDDVEIEEWQRLLRRQYAEMLSFKIKNTGEHPIFSEFAVTNPASGKTYKIAVRGIQPGENYCSCPDFSINTLGTCKHIEFVLSMLQKKSGAKKAFSRGCDVPYSEVYLSYGLRRQVRFRAGRGIPAGLRALIREYFDENEAELQKEAADDKKTAEAVGPVEEEQAGDTAADSSQLAVFSELLAGGAKLLTDLSRTISESGKTPKDHIKSLVSRDEATGQPFLKIPLPDKDVVQNLFSAFGKLLEGLR